jgi:alginate O-acetyltransferase complex protein AlgI
MVFSSLIFLFGFLPIVLAVYFAAPRAWRNGILLAASLYFYAWGETGYVVLMVISAAMNHLFGLWLESTRGRPSARWAIAIAIAANLSLLAWFKYANFAVANLNQFLGGGPGAPLNLDTVHLPIGISFFTFQALSYVIDVHRGVGRVERNPFRVALYISLFPQLIAGPIVRFHDIARELVARRPQLVDVAYGVRRFSLGLGKKVLIANLMASTADGIFAIPTEHLTPALAWLGATSYALQIYFDFSGYSDMAIGLGRIFGFHFLENFRYPYIARSLTDFWRRWHISLSTWFRDYLYIPMGGSRRGAARTTLHLFTVFALCGLWHGANWTFVIWGLYHGAFLGVERALRGRRFPPVVSFFGLLYTQAAVLVGWVIFRSESPAQTWAILKGLVGIAAGDGLHYSAASYLSPMFVLAFAAGVVASAPVLPAVVGWWERRAAAPGAARMGWNFAGGLVGAATLLAMLLASALQLSNASHNPFIYFRF